MGIPIKVAIPAPAEGVAFVPKPNGEIAIYRQKADGTLDASPGLILTNNGGGVSVTPVQLVTSDFWNIDPSTGRVLITT
jgi:hypothetical protein